MSAPPIVPSVEDLLPLSERVALRRWLDGRNHRWLRFLVALVAVGAIGFLLKALEEDDRLLVTLAAVDLVLVVAFVVAVRVPAARSWYRWMVVVLVAAQFGLLVLAFEAAMGPVTVFAALVFPALLVALRLDTPCAATLATLFAGTALGLNWEAAAEVSRTGYVFAVLVPNLIAVGTSGWFTERASREFLGSFRRLATRERERERLRGELDDARKIQLGMLPDREPDLGWLDVAGVCLPAAEVGGDYFDYITLDDGGLAVVMADVAGHGVASGLMIAGIRSCLHVLHDELGDPVRVVDRLDRMVRDSVRSRMFVTLTLAVLEPGGRRVRLVSAGHPPVLHWSARRRRVEEIGFGAPPLGTRLPHAFREETLEIEAGDLLVFYTDGLVEALDARLEAYGHPRLERALTQAAGVGSARAVRNDLLDDVARFKTDMRQEDDLSLVVLRRPVTEAGAAS